MKSRIVYSPIEMEQLPLQKKIFLNYGANLHESEGTFEIIEDIKSVSFNSFKADLKKNNTYIFPENLHFVSTFILLIKYQYILEQIKNFRTHDT